MRLKYYIFNSMRSQKLICGEFGALFKCSPFNRFSSAAAAASTTVAQLRIDHGLPNFLIPLPSRHEVCSFVVKPLSDTVGNLLENIQFEDRGIDKINAYSLDGIRIGKRNSVQTLLAGGDFDLEINDQLHRITVPPFSNQTSENLGKLDDVRKLVNELHASLNVDEFYLKKEADLSHQREAILQELQPFEEIKADLAARSATRTRQLTWLGLGAMGLQFGFLARLTWWEYSWDIMEPVTYFVGYGTSIAFFAYYVLTKQEFAFPQVFDREYLKKFHKDAKKSNFDIDRYNQLKEDLSQIQSDIRRLRDPLMFSLPLQQTKNLVPEEP